MKSSLGVRFYWALFVVVLLAGCASTPSAPSPVDDSQCVHDNVWSHCPSNRSAPNDSFPYKSIQDLRAATFEQRLDYLGSVHNALMAPERYSTHRDPLIRKGEYVALLAIKEKDNAFKALAVVALTYDPAHQDDKMLLKVRAIAQRDAILSSQIQSRVPVIPGYDTPITPRGYKMEYSMSATISEIRAEMEFAAKHGDANACEAYVDDDLNNAEQGVARWKSFDHPTVDSVCSQLPNAYQAVYQQRDRMYKMRVAAFRDGDPLVDRVKSQWQAKAFAVVSKCRSVGVDLDRIKYNQNDVANIQGTMLGHPNAFLRDGQSEAQYHQEIAELAYLHQESESIGRGVTVTPVLTPYIFINLVGNSCGP